MNWQGAKEHAAGELANQTCGPAAQGGRGRRKIVGNDRAFMPGTKTETGPNGTVGEEIRPRKRYLTPLFLKARAPVRGVRSPADGLARLPDER
jgi:hypothetical protein